MRKHCEKSDCSGDETLKIIFILIIALLTGLTAFAQSEEINLQNGIGEVTLARDDGHGNPGAPATSFMMTDIPIYCFVQLNSTKAVTVKMNFIAASVTGVKPGKIVVSASYKTDGRQDGVTFTGAPDDVWAAGKYRIDILLDGRAAKSLEFDIQKSAKDSAKEKLIAPTKPKYKTKQRLRRS